MDMGSAQIPGLTSSARGTFIISVTSSSMWMPGVER
jgi:hypothetical protein